MEQKHTCCVESCKRNFATENVLYFPFPLHDEILLTKWLAQVGRDNWKPTKETTICSKHFLGVDIDSHPNRKIPVLKPTAVPKIFAKNIVTKTAGNSNLKKPGANIISSPGNVPIKINDGSAAAVARKKTTAINVMKIKPNNQVIIPDKKNDQIVVKQNIQSITPAKQAVSPGKKIIRLNNSILPSNQAKPLSMLVKNQASLANILPVKQVSKILPKSPTNSSILSVKQSNQIKFSPIQATSPAKISPAPSPQLNPIKIAPNQTHVIPMAQSNIKNLPISQLNSLNLLPLQQSNLMSSLKSGSVCFMSPPGTQPLRKILPKAPIGKANGASPYIIVIPTFDNSKTNTTTSPVATMTKTAIPQNINNKQDDKKAVLRITVAKKCNSPDKNDGEKMNSLKTTGKLEIKNKKDNTMIIFSVDPATGKIVMNKRKLTNLEIADKNLRQRQKKIPLIKKNDASMNKLRRLRSKVEAESHDLKTNIRELRQTRMRSQEKIKKLQAEIAEAQEKLLPPLSPPKLTVVRKRRIGIDGKIIEDDPSPSPTNAKRIKLETALSNNKNASRNAGESSSFERAHKNVIDTIEFVDINNLTSPPLKPGSLSLKSELMS